MCGILIIPHYNGGHTEFDESCFLSQLHIIVSINYLMLCICPILCTYNITVLYAYICTYK